jgi:hypothetical protein
MERPTVRIRVPERITRPRKGTIVDESSNPDQPTGRAAIAAHLDTSLRHIARTDGWDGNLIWPTVAEDDEVIAVRMTPAFARHLTDYLNRQVIYGYTIQVRAASLIDPARNVWQDVLAPSREADAMVNFRTLRDLLPYLHLRVVDSSGEVAAYHPGDKGPGGSTIPEQREEPS